MGFFTIAITIILITLGFVYESVWSVNKDKLTLTEKKNALKEIDEFFKNVPSTYNKYYTTIHMLNYFHYFCNENNTSNPAVSSVYTSSIMNKTCSEIHSDPQLRFRYKDIILFDSGKICRAKYDSSNNILDVNYNSCDFLKGWYDKGIISKIDKGVLEKFIPPQTGSALKRTAVFFNGTTGYQANVFTTVPYLKITGFLLNKKGINKYEIAKIYPIDTFSVIRKKVKAADALIENYSYYIRMYAKTIYSSTNYNPYVFKYSLSSLRYRGSDDENKKKAVFIPGVGYYGLDTSLLVGLPNIYTYKEINGQTITSSDGNPLPSLNTNAYESLYQATVGSPYKNDDIVNIQSSDKIYAMKNSAPNSLEHYETTDWSSSAIDTLFALLRIGKDCKADDYDDSSCAPYIWYNSVDKDSLVSLSAQIFKNLYLKTYEYIYDNTDFKGPNQYGAIFLDVQVDSATGEKKAKLYKKTVNDYYKDLFHIDLAEEMKQKYNPFFGKIIYYPGGVTPSYEVINSIILIDNTSNVNYGIPLIDDDTVAIYSGYSISFAIPYIVDKIDDSTSSFINAVLGLFIKTYSITTVE